MNQYLEMHSELKRNQIHKFALMCFVVPHKVDPKIWEA